MPEEVKGWRVGNTTQIVATREKALEYETEDYLYKNLRSIFGSGMWADAEIRDIIRHRRSLLILLQGAPDNA